MHNKAQIPEWIIIFATLAICIAAIYNIVTFPGKTASAISIENASQLYNEQKKFIAYFGEAATLSSIQAYSDTANSPSGSKCGKTGDIIIWTEGCPNNAEIKVEFIKNLNNSLIGHGFEATALSISEKTYISLKEKFSETKRANSLLYYNLNYSYIPKISIAKPDLDFEKIYLSVKSKKTECDSRFKDNTELDKDVKIGRCIEELRLGGWNVGITSLGGYYIFNFNSKEPYIYDNSLKPITLTFALKKQ